MSRGPIKVRNLDGYGNAELPWSRPRHILEAGPLGADVAAFLSTTGPDGGPHTTGIGPSWLDGDFYFTSGPSTLKSRHIAANPKCSLALRLEGIDLTVEGTATRVTDGATLEKVAAIYRAGGWPAQVDNDALSAPYSAPSAGPAPWQVYRLRFHKAFAVASAEPYGATSWRFEP